MDGDSLPRVVVAADNLLAQAGLTALLEECGCSVQARVDGQQLAEAAQRLSPDIVALDLGWGAQGMGARLYELESDAPLLLLADEDDESLAALLPTLRRFPCFALLPRECDAEALAAAVDALLGGLIALAPAMSRLLAATGGATAAEALNPLTAREQEVLGLLADGLTNRAIAQRLGITPHTVKFHVNAIMGKLDAQSRTEAVVRATQRGLIAL